MRQCFILCCALAAIVLAGCNRDYRTFSDDTNRFSVDYPKSWNMKPVTQQGVAVTFESPREDLSDSSLPNFSVTAGDIPPALTAEEFAKAMIVAPKSYLPKFKLLEEGTIHVGRLDPYAMTFEYDLAGEILLGRQVFFVRNGYGYSVVFTLPAAKAAAYRKIIDQVVASFRIR